MVALVASLLIVVRLPRGVSSMQQQKAQAKRLLATFTPYFSSAIGLESQAEFCQSFHRSRQHSFVASRHDRSLYQFRMVGHDPDK